MREVETQRSKVSAEAGEKVLETRAGALSGRTCPGRPLLGEMKLGLVHPDVIVHLERDEKIEQDCFTAPVWATKIEHRKGVSGRFFPLGFWMAG